MANENRQVTKKVFVCIENDINVNGTILKKHSVGIIENIGIELCFQNPYIIPRCFLSCNQSFSSPVK